MSKADQSGQERKKMTRDKQALEWIDKINHAIGNIICFGLPLLGFLILYEVIMRYAFNRPTIWVHDISQFLFGATYMLGAGYTLLRRGHVNMDMLYVRFTRKGKALADVVAGLLVFLFLGVLTWQSGMMAWESVLFKERLIQSVYEPPLYPIKIIFFIGCVLFLLQVAAQWVRDVIMLFSKPEKLEKIDTIDNIQEKGKVEL